MLSNFTPVFNNTADLAHVNITYTVSQLGITSAPINTWYLFILLGVGLLLLSCVGESAIYQDLAGVLSSGFLLISAIWSFSLDVITGSGMSSQIVNGIPEWTYIESHVIYHIDLAGFFLTVIFLLSLGNLYRLWLDYHKVVSPDLPVPDQPRVEKQQNPHYPREAKTGPNPRMKNYEYANKDEDLK